MLEDEIPLIFGLEYQVFINDKTKIGRNFLFFFSQSRALCSQLNEIEIKSGWNLNS